MYLLSIYLLLPVINAIVISEIHRSKIYHPISSCTFLRNASWSTDVSIQSCIWECVYENNCQTAVYFTNEKVCSMFAEFCKSGSIQSSGNVQASVICHRKKHEPNITCSSSVAPNQAETEKITLSSMMMSTVQITTTTSSTTTTIKLSTASAPSTTTTTAAAMSTTTTETTTITITISTILAPLTTAILPTVVTANTCPTISCSITPSVQNPANNYQVEHIDINCTASLSNFTLVQILQRNNNETLPKQYETFWNTATNMTFVQDVSMITFTWYSLPGHIIDVNGFPYFTEAHVTYETNGPGRVTSNDTWLMEVESLCGNLATYSGTF